MHDNLLLLTSESGQAEDGVQDGESGGGDFPPLVEGLARVGMIMLYWSIRRVPKTLSGDDQPDWLLLNQDNGENWLGFTGRRRPRKFSLEQIATCVYRKPYPAMILVLAGLISLWMGRRLVR